MPHWLASCGYLANLKSVVWLIVLPQMELESPLLGYDVKLSMGVGNEKRKAYTPEEKVAIDRRHLLDSVAVSDLCDEHQPNPNAYYRW